MFRALTLLIIRRSTSKLNQGYTKMHGQPTIKKNFLMVYWARHLRIRIAWFEPSIERVSWEYFSVFVTD